MRKVTTIVAAAAVALAFTACNKTNNSVTPEAQGGTYAAVTAKVVTTSGTRALTDGQQDVKGADQSGEDAVKDSYLFFKEGQSKVLTMTQIGDKYQSEAFETAPNASANVALVLNKGVSAVDLTPADFSKTKTVALSDIRNFIKTDGFLMTSTIEDAQKNTIDIKKGQTKGTVEAGNDATTNNFSFDVERVVAKLQVSAKNGYTIGEDLKKMGNVSEELTFSMAGSAKESYLFRDNAGKRQLAADEGKHIYTGFKSLIDKVSNDDADLQKVSDEVANKYYVTPLAVNKVDASNKVSIKDGGFYFLENSQYGGENVATAKKQILFKRIAYAKVYTTFAATAGKKINAETLDKTSYKSSDLTNAAAADFDKERKYTVQVSEHWYNAHKDDAALNGKLKEVKPTEQDGKSTYTLDVTDVKGTFYVGADGVIYDTQLAAAAAGNTTYRKFDGGKMVYMLPANAQKAADGDLINYCDTRRNNIYDLTITAIEGLGENYDPVDPKDPNIQEPKDNPGEPEPDPNKPVQDETTYMRVDAVILLWNDVNRDVVLGK